MDELSRSLLLIAGLAALAVAVLAMRRSPTLGLIGWLVSLCFVPYWLGVDLVVGWSPATLVAGAVVLAVLPLRHPGFSYVDGAVAFLVVSYIFAALIGAGTVSSGFVLLAHWGLGYLLGRAMTDRLDVQFIFKAVAVVFTIVAVLAIVEFATGWNPFVLLHADNPLFSRWSVLQERGGVMRVEGAFGHSIALGASLALAIPLVLAARFKLLIRAGMTVIILVAVAFTLSRSAMVCSLLAVALSILYLKELSNRLKAVFLGTTAVVATALYPLISTVFTDAADEAAGSAAYRADLTPLFGSMQLIGQSPAFRHAPDGTAYFGTFRSIDSALILMGLTYGLIPLFIAIGLSVAAVVLVVSGRSTPPTIAMVAQLPALATVALITQYAMFVWFMAGLAVSTQLLRREARDENSLGSPDSLWHNRAYSARASAEFPSQERSRQ